jgi:hypothetical protein
MSVKVSSTVQPTNRPNMEDWFMQFRVSSMYQEKPQKPDRHVCDIEKMGKLIRERDLTFSN